MRRVPIQSHLPQERCATYSDSICHMQIEYPHIHIECAHHTEDVCGVRQSNHTCLKGDRLAKNQLSKVREAIAAEPPHKN